MKYLRVIDKTTGLFIRDDFLFDDETEIGLDVEPSQGFYLPKWDGENWIESKTQEEIELIKASVVIEPTLDERVATTETKVVTIEETIDVLFGGV